MDDKVPLLKICAQFGQKYSFPIKISYTAAKNNEILM